MSYMPQPGSPPGFTQPGNNAQNRRNSLVQKLMQQFQQGQQGKASAGTGTPLRSGSQTAPMLHTQQTTGNFVNQGIRSQLGPGGFSLPSLQDSSGFQGGEVAPGSPTPMPLPQAVPMPLPGQQRSMAGVDPTASAPTPAGAANFTGQGAISPTGLQTIQAPFSDTLGSQPGNVDPGFNISPVPSDSIHLGNGTYWSPTAGLINPTAPDATAGVAARTATGTFKPS